MFILTILTVVILNWGLYLLFFKKKRKRKSKLGTVGAWGGVDVKFTSDVGAWGSSRTSSVLT